MDNKQDGGQEKARGFEDKSPYGVEPDGQHACDKCNAGTQWMVVFAPTDTAEGTSYGLEQDAEDIAGMMNNAYRNGWNAALASVALPAGECRLKDGWCTTHKQWRARICKAVVRDTQ